MTGRIVFNDQGRRTDFYMEVLELGKEGLHKIATWDPVAGINYTRSQSEVNSQISQSLQNKTIIVAARLGMPYLRLKYVEKKSRKIFTLPTFVIENALKGSILKEMIVLKDTQSI